MIIPEFILLDTIEKGLEFVKQDYSDHTNSNTKEDSYLHRLLEGINIQRYDYLTQGKKILLAEEDDPRKLTIDLMYNLDVSKPPSIYIALAAEQSGLNGLGLDEGYKENYAQEGSIVSTFTRRINTSYNIMVVSDNSNEVVMLYHFLRGLLLSLHPHLSLMGIENIAMSGQDLQLYSELIPKGMFMRAIGLNVQYEVTVPDLHTKLIVNDIQFKGKLIQ